MVHLSRIYTRTGDDGTTGLGDGTRLPKHHPRIAAYGTVDELSSVLGLALAGEPKEPFHEYLRAAQNDLFDVGADLCVPGAPRAPGASGAGAGRERLRIQPVYTRRLEGWIDACNEKLAPLSSFVLAGGTQLAAWLHLARTVCRRAERLVSELLESEPDGVNPEVLRYLNRLSDLLFVLARLANDEGRRDVLWKPGATQGGGA